MEEVVLSTTRILALIATVLFAGWAAPIPSAVQQDDGCGPGKAARQILRDVTADGFAFAYESSVFEVGDNWWCHVRKTTNKGPAVYINWSDKLGVILDGHMIAQSAGMLRAVSWERGET